MLSLNSAKAGSREFRGKSEFAVEFVPLGVVCDARRLVREGGRSGVVGLEGILVREWEELRWWFADGGWPAGVVDAAILSF